MKKGTEKKLGSTSRIGEQLKTLFETIEQEPIPSQFLDLLEKLDQAENAASNKSGGSK